jgi:hypothetical protein
MSKGSEIRISKLDAARRQLRTAITLWFTDGDPVSVHALAFAAYEIFHTVSKKRDPFRRDLLLDSDMIKDEYRRDWEKLVKKNVVFFKHADRDSDAVIDFDPTLNEFFILYATVGRQLCGESQSEEESHFGWWFHINRPELLTDRGREFVANHIPSDVAEYTRKMNKREFFEALRDARTLMQGRSPTTGRRFFLPTDTTATV